MLVLVVDGDFSCNIGAGLVGIDSGMAVGWTVGGAEEFNSVFEVGVGKDFNDGELLVDGNFFCGLLHFFGAIFVVFGFIA